MDVAIGLMVFWAYMMTFLLFAEDGGSSSKATSWLTAAFIVVAIIL